MRHLLKTFIVLFLCFGLIACDSNQVSDDPADPTLATPDDDTVERAGPASQVIRADFGGIITEMDRLLYMYLPKVLGQEGDLDDDSDDYEKASVDVCISDDTEDNITCNVDLSPLIDGDCDEVGTKTVTSFVTITVEEDGLSGHFDGNFSVEYSSDCQETPTLEVTGSDTCEATTTMTGSITAQINSMWTFSKTDDEPNAYDSEFEIEASTEDGDMTITVGRHETAQNYELTYTAFVDTGLTNLQPDDDSSLELDGTWYYVDDVTTAVEAAAITVACPALY